MSSVLTDGLALIAIPSPRGARSLFLRLFVGGGGYHKDGGAGSAPRCKRG